LSFLFIFLFNRAFKKRAPRAVKELKKFAEKMMKTPDVRIDSKLNKEIWSQGIKCVLYSSFYLYKILIISHVPYRVRVRLARQRNEDEDSPHKLYTLVTHVRVPAFKGFFFFYKNVILIFFLFSLGLLTANVDNE
jgi:ribosomal protein L31E